MFIRSIETQGTIGFKPPAQTRANKGFHSPPVFFDNRRKPDGAHVVKVMVNMQSKFLRWLVNRERRWNFLIGRRNRRFPN
jgi:hypothetical protein